MKFLAVKFEGADLIDRFCGYSAGVEIKDLQGPEGFFVLNLTKEKKSRETMTPTRLASPGRISKKRDKVFAREKRFTKFDCILSYRDVNTILLPFYGMSLIQ